MLRVSANFLVKIFQIKLVLATFCTPRKHVLWKKNKKNQGDDLVAYGIRLKMRNSQRFLVLPASHSDQKYVCDKILTRSLKGVLKSCLYEKMLRPRAIHTFFEIMLVKFAFFSNLSICKIKL